MNAYITDLAGFLPNAPVGNADVERILGMFRGKPSRTLRMTLKKNGIHTRHYAIDPETGALTHNNAQLAAAAVRSLLGRAQVDMASVDLLACGTASPDQFKPGHASMVQGELQAPPWEVASFAGVCGTGASALKYAWLNVLTGQARSAISTGSELASSFSRASQAEGEMDPDVLSFEERPEFVFEREFLRWMLSDGAGAALVRSTPNHGRLSLRIDAIDACSLAGRMPSCMYSGAVRREDGTLGGWREAANPQEAARRGYFLVRQDLRLLNENIVKLGIEHGLMPSVRRRGITPDQIDWFLPHLSSEYFRDRLHSGMAEHGFEIPQSRWFTNLSSRGNIGSASIYVILEELLYSGRLKPGQRLLCSVPESARFSYHLMYLTVV